VLELNQRYIILLKENIKEHIVKHPEALNGGTLIRRYKKLKNK